MVMERQRLRPSISGTQIGNLARVEAQQNLRTVLKREHHGIGNDCCGGEDKTQ